MDFLFWQIGLVRWFESKSIMKEGVGALRSRSRWLKRLAMMIFVTLLLALAIEAVMISLAVDRGAALRFWLSYRLWMLL